MEEPRGERWIPGPQSHLTHHTPNQACSSIFITYWATVILLKESFLKLTMEKDSGCGGAIHCVPSETRRCSNWLRALPVTHGDTVAGAVSNLDFSLRVPSLFPQPQPGVRPALGSEPRGLPAAQPMSCPFRDLRCTGYPACTWYLLSPQVMPASWAWAGPCCF